VGVLTDRAASLSVRLADPVADGGQDGGEAFDVDGLEVAGRGQWQADVAAFERASSPDPRPGDALQ